MIIQMIIIPLLVISLIVNICLMVLNHWMLGAWEKDVNEKIQLCKQINQSWGDRYDRLLQELEQCYDQMRMEDDRK